MRVALLYSGLPRLWQTCHATQMRLFPGAEIDVFFHFWDTVDLAEKQAIVETMKPVSFVFEPPRDDEFVDRYPEVTPDTINIPSRLVSQYMSWRNVATQFLPYAPRYDLAVRSRSDLYFFDAIHYDPAAIANGDTALLAYRWPENRDCLSDMFAIGIPRVIVYFLSLLDSLWHYAPETPFNPEALITRHLAVMVQAMSDAALHTLPDLPFFVRRPHMDGWTDAQCRAAGPGVSKWQDPEVVAAFQRYHGTAHGTAGLAHVEAFRKNRTD